MNFDIMYKLMVDKKKSKNFSFEIRQCICISTNYLFTQSFNLTPEHKNCLK